MSKQRLVDSLARFGFVREGKEVTNGFCKLRLDDTKVQDVVSIRYIWSHERRSGHGNRAMAAIICLADEYLVTLLICPAPLSSTEDGKMRRGRLRDAPDEDRLTRWYESLGFVNQHDGTMIRVPLTGKPSV